MVSVRMVNWLRKLGFLGGSRKPLRNTKASDWRRRLDVERLEDRAVPAGLNPNELINTALSPTQLAQSLVGSGVAVSNVTFTGGSASTGSFNFADPTVVGFSQGILLSSGSAADAVGPNVSDWTSTDFQLPGDADLDRLSGFDTHDAAVLEFDFVPTANQVVFNYAFASDEYPEWVNTPFNDVFAFMVNGTNYAEVRQIAGDPMSPFVPVAVNNINNGNALYPDFVPARPDLFRPNYYNAAGASAIDLEYEGITKVLTFQAPVTPGVVNHMKLAIADASDGIYDSAVFIQAGSIVSNENPVADLSLTTSKGTAPVKVTAIVEGEDPNGLAISYTIYWGDGTSSSGPLDSPTNDSEKTALVDHTYTTAGNYIVTLVVSNGSLQGISKEDIEVLGGTSNPSLTVTNHPGDQTVFDGDWFTFTADAVGNPAPTVQWQVSTDSGATFVDIAGATSTTYSAYASLTDDGNLYQAVFTNEEDSVTTTAALLTVLPFDATPPDAPVVMLAEDTGVSAYDGITQNGTLIVQGVEDGALVEYSNDAGETWSDIFTPAEGLNNLLVRQTDAAGNVSDETLFAFTLDTSAPAAPDVTLADDSGSLADDLLTNAGLLTLGNLETGALVEYSTDNGNTWTDAFTPAEGANSVLVRQTDVAGNISDATSFAFTLDTSAPAAPTVALANHTGKSATDFITKDAALSVGNLETGALVEYSTDNGNTWTDAFIPAEGANSVLVRQTDAAGNISDATLFAFTLDTSAPVAPSIALANDTGKSASDLITKDAALTIGNLETGALVEYSTDNGATWTGSFTAVEGANSVLVRQTDAAGNVSGTASLAFTLDTAAPHLSPTFSTALPLLVGAAGITVAPNASDPWGIDTQAAGPVDTSSAGAKVVHCTATDLAGNSASVDVPYVVGYGLTKITPLSGATFKRLASIPVSFQVVDANGLLSDARAATLAPSIRVTFPGQSPVKPQYNKKTNTFSATLKTAKPPVGIYNVTITITLGGVEVGKATIAVKIV